MELLNPLLIIYLCVMFVYSLHSTVVRDALADHYITDLAIVNQQPVDSFKTVYKLNNEKLKHELSQVDWSSSLDCDNDNPNKVLDLVVSKLNNIHDKCIYNSHINANSMQDSSWITNSLIQMCNKRKDLLNIYLSNTSNKQNELIYKIYRNRTNRLVVKPEIPRQLSRLLKV